LHQKSGISGPLPPTSNHYAFSSSTSQLSELLQASTSADFLHSGKQVYSERALTVLGTGKNVLNEVFTKTFLASQESSKLSMNVLKNI
jgi:hypothetical protein